MCMHLACCIQDFLVYSCILCYFHRAIFTANRDYSMFSGVIFSKVYGPNKHNALSLARVFKSKPNIMRDSPEGQKGPGRLDILEEGNLKGQEQAIPMC